MLRELINLNSNATIIVSLGIMLFSSFLMTRLTKKLGLPNVTAYIISGIIIGPNVLGLIPGDLIMKMDFVTDIALAFIAFDVGRFLKSNVLRQNTSQILVITLWESLTAATIVTITMYFVFKLPLAFSLLIGAIGAATAPASTIMTIRQYGAKGNFVDTVLQVVALDDMVALLAFSVSSAAAQALSSNQGLGIRLFLLPILLNLLAIGMGIGFGHILDRLINPKRTKDNKLVLTITMILLLTGLCSALHISPLLASMALGTTFINTSSNGEIYKQLNNFTPPILIMFFVISGMRLDLASLLTGGIIGLTYFLVRIIGKYLGAYIGASISGAEEEVKKYLGLALIPQAGVSIGLAFLGQRILPTGMGNLLATIILSSSILYEIVGPISGKAALYLSGAIPAKEREKDAKTGLSLKDVKAHNG